MPEASVNPRAALLARLTDPAEVVLFDGAMGTMLYARGVFINQCYDELVLRAPDLVRDVHAAYAKAGAEAQPVAAAQVDTLPGDGYVTGLGMVSPSGREARKRGPDPHDSVTS